MHKYLQYDIGLMEEKWTKINIYWPQMVFCYIYCGFQSIWLMTLVLSRVLINFSNLLKQITQKQSLTLIIRLNITLEMFNTFYWCGLKYSTINDRINLHTTDKLKTYQTCRRSRWIFASICRTRPVYLSWTRSLCRQVFGRSRTERSSFKFLIFCRHFFRPLLNE